MTKKLLASLLTASLAAAELCANINTSTSKPSSAYGILQGGNCWCSNYGPDQDAQRTGCTSPCPGYPFDMCGAIGLYSYVLLNEGMVQGVKGSVESTSTASSVAAATSSNTSAPSTTATTASATEPQRQDVTATIFVTPTAASAAPAPDPPPPVTGPVLAGIIVGSLAGLVVLAVCAYLLYARRRDGGPQMHRKTASTSTESVHPFAKPSFADTSGPLEMYSRGRLSVETVEAYMPGKSLRVMNPDPPEGT
ncbi:hypothetical protein UVI_02029820 [Ustilaginoidea virens]|uniref:WSC domain-containing protein n=1 Tax=Ustilaginoidea virens TaxID=1159556 RepID=A0A1B5KVS0_USTVR|nr:hypothetical protein UVI_02029820 [Ustilaginoidea virens]